MPTPYLYDSLLAYDIWQYEIWLERLGLPNAPWKLSAAECTRYNIAIKDDNQAVVIQELSSLLQNKSQLELSQVSRHPESVPDLTKRLLEAREVWKSVWGKLVKSRQLYLKIDSWWESEDAHYVQILQKTKSKPVNGSTTWWATKKIPFAMWLAGSEVQFYGGLLVDPAIEPLISDIMYYTWDRQERKVRRATKNYYQNQDLVDELWRGES